MVDQKKVEELVADLRRFARTVEEEIAKQNRIPKSLLEFGDEVVRGKYALPGEDSYADVVARVVGFVVYSSDRKKLEKLRESDYFTTLFPEIRNTHPQDFLARYLVRVFLERLVIPGGRILFGAGQKGKRKVTLTNCYVLASPEDSFEGIFKTATEMALTYRAGGGVGVDVSTLRPEGSPVNNAALTSSGSWSFVDFYSEVTGVVGQKGRRGALLVSLRVDHPDVLSFIHMKSTPSPRTKEVLEFLRASGWSDEKLRVAEKVLVWNQARFSNISVQITDEFMKAVEKDEKFVLRFHNEKVQVEKVIRARDIWEQLVKSAWESGDPGLLFRSTAERYSTTQYFAPVVTTNPCGEQWLSEYDNCNLAAVNLAYPDFVRGGDGSFERVVSAMIVFMDLVIDYNFENHPLLEQAQAAIQNRRIGLGFAGLAELLANLELAWYEHEMVEEVIQDVVGGLATWSYRTSVELGKVWGSFPNFNPEEHWNQPFFHRIIDHLPDELKVIWEKHILGQKFLRNSALNTVAPTGSTSSVLGTSSGIEPFFFRNVRRYSPSLGKTFFYTYAPYENVPDDWPDDELPPHLWTAHQIRPYDRVFVQSVAQTFVDNAISSTINLPESASVEDVGKVYKWAWEMGLKGVTVFREGSKYSVVADSEDEKQKKEVDTLKSSVLIPSSPKELFSRPTQMDCVRYRVPTPENGGSKLNVIICGDGKKPLEIYLASRNANCHSHKIALNMVLSIILTSLRNAGLDELYNTILDKVIEKLRQIKDTQPFNVFGEPVHSSVGTLSVILDMFRRGETPEDRMRQAIGVVLPTTLPKADSAEKSLAPLSSKTVVNLYSDEPIDLSDLPVDAFVSTCPTCGAVHVSKGHPWPFDCDHPCQVCGYAGKCSGE